MFYSPTARAAAFSIATSLAILSGCNGDGRTEEMTTSSQSSSSLSGPRGRTLSEEEPAQQTAWTSGKQTTAGEAQTADWIAYPTGDRKTSAVLLERMGAKQVRLGQPYEYQMKVTNLTDKPLSGVEVSERLGENFKVTKADPQAEMRDGMNVYHVGELGPHQSRMITVTGTASAAGDVSSCASLAYNPTLCTVAQVIAPQIRISKSGPQQADICEDLVYTYRITNSGTGDETDVTVRDPLPDGLKTIDGKNVVEFVIDRVAQGQTREYEARLRADRAGDYQSQANASSVSGQVQSEQVATKIVAPELKVAVTGPEKEFVGNTITYDVSVQNTGTTAAKNATLAFEGGGSQASMVAVSDQREGEGEAQPAAARVGGSGGEMGDIAPGQTPQYRVTVPAAQAGAMKVTAVAKAPCAPDASAVAMTTIGTIPALLLEVVDQQDPIRVNSDVKYTIRVTNQGSGPDTNISITATLPEQLQFVRAGGVSNPTTEDHTIKFGTVPTLAAGQSVEWTVEAKAIKAGDVRFRLDMRSDSLESNVTETEATRLY